MITKLDIENYKSIQKLSLSPGRVNLFIGKPASGKSNIIEAISLLSKRNVSIKELVRMKEYNDLIYDRDIERKLSVKIDGDNFEMLYKDGSYLVKYFQKTIAKEFLNYKKQKKDIVNVNILASGAITTTGIVEDLKYKNIQEYVDNEGNFCYSINYQDIADLINEYLSENIFYYKFKLASEFNDKTTERLNAPFGNNLPQIILTRGSLKKIITEILSDYDLKLGLNPNENTIKILKEQDGVLYEYPFVSLSDSLQRIIFYVTAMHTENSTLLLEEPEAQVFPFYNKYLGEKIALDETNQYFVATHNFPFLSSILQKTDPMDLRIYITYYEDYQTKVYSFPQEKFSEIYEMEESFFLNLKKYTEQA
jgi:AAA15 family ATPase/GTPase